MVYSPAADRLLFCRRTRDPYFGLYNLPGGKIEEGEGGEDAAYRELWEETDIGRGDIALTHLMDFTYHLSDCYVEVWAGRLRREVTLRENEHPLEWLSADGDFADQAIFAGEGNIAHMAIQVEIYREQVLNSKGIIHLMAN